jgi:membrane protease YdiL (CAAX protease family)
MFIFPFFLMYEILAYFLFDPSDYVIRNSADIIFRDIFEIITNNTLITYNGLLLILIFSFIFYNFKNKSPKFTLSYIFFMFIEGIFFGLLLVFILNGFSVFNYSQQNYFFIDYSFMFYSCLGAGIWEEILFRYLLLSSLIKVFKKIIDKYSSIILSIFISALLFSMFHYIGSLGDVFNIYTFIVRFVGGIYLGIIYLYRGLGISMISHIIYDFILVTIPVL